MKVKLCDACLEKLKSAAARGGRNGSIRDKRRAGALGVLARNAMKLTFKGKTLRVSEWSRLTKISKKTLYRRIAAKLPVEKILSVPQHGAEHLPAV